MVDGGQPKIWAALFKNMYFHVPEGILVDGESINKAVASNCNLAIEMSTHNTVRRAHCGFFATTTNLGTK